MGSIKRGACTCPSGSLPAAEIEQLVVGEARAALTDRALIKQIIEEGRKANAPQLDQEEATRLLAGFEGVWEQLIPREQARVLRLLIEHVEYDSESQSVSVTFRPSGISSLAMLAGPKEAA